MRKEKWNMNKFMKIAKENADNGILKGEGMYKRCFGKKQAY